MPPSSGDLFTAHATPSAVGVVPDSNSAPGAEEMKQRRDALAAAAWLPELPKGLQNAVCLVGTHVPPLGDVSRSTLLIFSQVV